MSKFNPFADYEVNEDLEVEGVWLVDRFFKARVARAGGRNEKFTRIFEAVTKPHRQAIQKRILPKETDQALMREIYAKSVITDWAIVELDEKNKPKLQENGEPIWKNGYMFHPETFEVVPFSVDMVIATYRKQPELFEYHKAQANDISVYQDEEAEEEDAKN